MKYIKQFESYKDDDRKDVIRTVAILKDICDQHLSYLKDLGLELDINYINDRRISDINKVKYTIKINNNFILKDIILDILQLSEFLNEKGYMNTKIHLVGVDSVDVINLEFDDINKNEPIYIKYKDKEFTNLYLFLEKL